jgi:cytochrome c-type protein NapC
MIGPTGLLYVLIILTIGLVGVFFLRPSVTAGTGGKILAFMAMCALPAVCVGGGLFSQMQRSEQTKFCISCHAMENYGKSLYVDDPSYLPAKHFQNHRVPADMACYACHADYTIYGPVKDKYQGLKRVYMQYISKPPEHITIPGGYNNHQCLRCHSGARGFEENAIHQSIMDTLTSNQVSCISSGCHDTIHNASEVGHLKMWRPGS